MKKTEQEKKPKPGPLPNAAESSQPEQPAGAKAQAAAKPDAAAEQPGEETPADSPAKKTDEAGGTEKPEEDTGAGDKPAASDDGQGKTAPDARPDEATRAEDSGSGPENAEQPDEEEAAGTPEAPAPEPPVGEDASSADELARLRTELLAARCLNAAYAAGVRPELAGDTATLAAAEAGPDGDAEKAVAAILKRHPEWKAAEEGGKKKATTGGFKLGADPDKAAAKPAGKPGETTGKKRWNRFK